MDGGLHSSSGDVNHLKQAAGRTRRNAILGDDIQCLTIRAYRYSLRIGSDRYCSRDTLSGRVYDSYAARSCNIGSQAIWAEDDIVRSATDI